MVWRRNFDVFTKTAVNFFPSLLEPILYLLAFGFGLGGYITNIQGQSYLAYIAPALVAISIMNGAFFECTFASFVRMYFQKTFDAIVATPVSVEEVVAGELLWGATRSTINSTIVLAVVAAFGLGVNSFGSVGGAACVLRRINVCLHSNVLHRRRPKHRLLQFPLVSLPNPHVLPMRHILPPIRTAGGCTGSRNGYSTPNTCSKHRPGTYLQAT